MTVQKENASGQTTKRRSPIEIMIDSSDLRCTVCGTSAEIGCKCWSPCRCGWSFRTGTSCRNPAHRSAESV